MFLRDQLDGFSLDEIDLWYANNTLYLPSEHDRPTTQPLPEAGLFLCDLTQTQGRDMSMNVFGKSPSAEEGEYFRVYLVVAPAGGLCCFVAPASPGLHLLAEQ